MTLPSGAPRRLMGWLLLLIVLSVGCMPIDEKEAQETEEPFEAERLQALPDLESLINQAKPGHWISAHQRITAVEDFQGAVESRVLDNANRPIPTELASHAMLDVRPLVLPAGEPKEVETRFYVPRRLDRETRAVTLENRLIDRRGNLVASLGGSVSLMPDFRFFGLALSTVPERWNYLATLPTNAGEPGLETQEFTKVVVPKIGEFVPLPSDLFGWTSIAWIVWDDFDPALLEPGQRQALVDWIHFGGQLIVSGSDGLDKLGTSELASLLPVDADETVSMSIESLESLNAVWSPGPGEERTRWEFAEANAPLIRRLRLREGARFLPGCDGLVADRPVGRGRIVVTAFSLAERSFVRWPSIDNFVHNALLLEPRRRFSDDQLESRATFVDHSGSELDPRLGSSLRFFVRDWGDRTAEVAAAGPAAAVASTEPAPATSSSSSSTATAWRWRTGPYESAAQSGVAGWNDLSAVAIAARRTLDASTGIEPPSVAFVAYALVAYLIVLVPLNWIVFRLLGRVEWAWLAAPLIAIIAAFAIVRIARLDVGFARNRTELTIVEFPADYQRAHVTRFATVYSSLSTRFEIEYDEAASRAQPWGNPARAADVSFVGEPKPVRLRRAGATTLEGFDVVSNSAEMLHTESFVDRGGRLEWRLDDAATGGSIVNGTDLAVDSGVIVRIDRNGEWSGGVIEGLDVESQRAVSLRPIATIADLFELFAETDALHSTFTLMADRFGALDTDRSGRLTLDELARDGERGRRWNELLRRLARRGDGISREGIDLEQYRRLAATMPDETLRVAALVDLWIAGLRRQSAGTWLVGSSEIPDTETWRPAVSQTRSLGLVIASLEPADLPEPASDVNRRRSLDDPDSDDEEER
ncbi:MAG TPA: hypothetical protein PLI18_00675 [Pirellulaceae bacterium]|nr:hypothetical protein [Pirellulaceae bacterium]